MKSTPSSIDMFDWSPIKSEQAEEEAVSTKTNWALIGEIDIPISPSPRAMAIQPKLTPRKPPQRHNCISDDMEFHSEELEGDEREGILEMKPSFITSFEHSQASSESLEDELSFLSETSNHSKSKRRRDNDSGDAHEDSNVPSSEDMSFKSRKRRRVGGRNRALCAAEFEDIFAQIGC